MTEQEVTYTTVRFHKSSVFQNEVRSEETQSAKEIGHRGLQYNHETHELQKTRNCHHNSSTMENDINLKEETLRTISVESVQYNALLDLFNREQNRWYKKTKSVLASPQHTARCVEMHWFCHGIKCYYFIMDIRTWHECKQTCQNYSLSFLKIDDKDELKFLHHQVIPDRFWIGLSYNYKKKEWSWIDNSQLNWDLVAQKPLQKTGYCVFFSMAGLYDDDCGKRHLCICEKEMEKSLPHCAV